MCQRLLARMCSRSALVSCLYVASSYLMLSYFTSRHFRLTPDPAVYEAAIAALDKNLVIYDQILGKQKYLAGNVSTVLSFVFAINFATLTMDVFSGNHDHWYLPCCLWLTSPCSGERCYRVKAQHWPVSVDTWVCMAVVYVVFHMYIQLVQEGAWEGLLSGCQGWC